MVAIRYSECPCLPALLERYPRNPSYALIRTPETEYLRKIDFAGPSLDHCCGDGAFTRMVCPNGFDAGVDFSLDVLNSARLVRKSNGNGSLYGELRQSDVSKSLPWPEATFNLVLNNSGLEHVNGLEGALREVSRVLRPGGRFVFTLFAKRALEWWPGDLEEGSRNLYVKRQPMFNLLSLEEWIRLLMDQGMRIVDFESHFDREENEFNIRYDYAHSMYYLAKRPLPPKLAFLHKRPRLSRWYFGRMLRKRTYCSYPNEDAGASYCITAVKLPANAGQSF